jgi:hypothetical protein
VLVEKLKIRKLPVKMPIMTGDWCENRVQMERKCGKLCFFKGWKDFAEKIKMSIGDTLEFQFRVSDFILHMYS